MNKTQFHGEVAQKFQEISLLQQLIESKEKESKRRISSLNDDAAYRNAEYEKLVSVQTYLTTERNNLESVRFN